MKEIKLAQTGGYIFQASVEGGVLKSLEILKDNAQKNPERVLPVEEVKQLRDWLNGLLGSSNAPVGKPRMSQEAPLEVEHDYALPKGYIPLEERTVKSANRGPLEAGDEVVIEDLDTGVNETKKRLKG